MAAPNAPTNLITTADERYTITLTWVAPVDGDTPTFYSIYYGTEESTVDVLLGTVAYPTVTYDHTPVDDGATFYYEVFANNGDGQSVTGATNSGTSWDVPDAPISVATVDGNTVVTVSWDAPVDIGGTEITEYHIYRGVALGALVEIGTTAADRTWFASTGLTNNTTYYFAVSAENVRGEGAQSLAVSAKPEAVISTEENLLQWVCDSVGMSVFKAYGVASFVAPISDKKKILGIYASFITTDNVTAETNIVVNVDAHTVLVYEGGVRSSNLYDLLVMVLYR